MSISRLFFIEVAAYFSKRVFQDTAFHLYMCLKYHEIKLSF
jgi:hypothetical protein